MFNPVFGLFSYHKTLLILHTEPLIPFIYTTVSLCPCVTFRVSQLPAVIFSATYWDEVAVQQSGEHGCSVAQEARMHTDAPQHSDGLVG